MAKIRDEVGVSRLFTVAERVDVEAALLLLGAAPSLVRGKRWDVWPRLCSAMRQWHDGRVAARKDLLRDDQARWLKYTEATHRDLLGQLLRLRFARERWLRATFTELCAHHGVSTAVELAATMYSFLDPCGPEREDYGSVIYVGCTQATSRCYYGLVENRCPQILSGY